MTHEVRIIGGQWKRSKLPVANRPGLRPTPDRVRETLFNWLGQELTGWRVLDAFAGSGALGFETASRGAAEVLLLESDAALVHSLAAVKARLQAGAVQVIAADALAWLARCAPARFDLVLLDPPFDANVFDAALAAAAPTAAPGGFIYLEAPREFMPAPLGFTRHRYLRAGAVHAHLFVREQG
ncbi:MAG: 16S rRNA (guanine(966)-N(2))-methyltransferase RsmD [Burkholderiaceae bacterium]|nr:16S rRNA (guanine(966)-N(2))-methyltransferase RsmD [Burkholderiaceae bacterium]